MNKHHDPAEIGHLVRASEARLVGEINGQRVVCHRVPDTDPNDQPRWRVMIRPAEKREDQR